MVARLENLRSSSISPYQGKGDRQIQYIGEVRVVYYGRRRAQACAYLRRRGRRCRLKRFDTALNGAADYAHITCGAAVAHRPGIRVAHQQCLTYKPGPLPKISLLHEHAYMHLSRGIQCGRIIHVRRPKAHVTMHAPDRRFSFPRQSSKQWDWPVNVQHDGMKQGHRSLQHISAGAETCILTQPLRLTPIKCQHKSHLCRTLSSSSALESPV